MSESDTPKKGPPTKERAESSASDPGYRSRSQSRRSRRRKQQQGQKGQQQKKQQDTITEDRDEEDAQAGAVQQAPGINGPVSQAKQQRGEIPQKQVQKQDEGGGSDLSKQDGLKLRIELNLDIELELKAKINGDITLALL